MFDPEVPDLRMPSLVLSELSCGVVVTVERCGIDRAEVQAVKELVQ
jgi:hypothetical protein